MKTYFWLTTIAIAAQVEAAFRSAAQDGVPVAPAITIANSNLANADFMAVQDYERHPENWRTIAIMRPLQNDQLIVAVSRQSAANSRKLKHAAFFRKPLRGFCGGLNMAGVSYPSIAHGHL